MVALGEAGRKQNIKTSGLVNTKGKNVMALSKALIADHDGKVPADRDALEKLPGVGRKTANVVMNVAFDQETFAVDTHNFRISNRTGLAPGQTPLPVETTLDRVVPQPFPLHPPHCLILTRRSVSRAPHTQS